MATPELLLGPLLRYVDDARATVWVETSAACAVEVLVDLPSGDVVRSTTETLGLHGHHYALLVVEGLPAGQRLPYRIEVAGARLWPPVEDSWTWPASEIRTPDLSTPLRLAFGSCRRAGDDDAASVELVGVDALSTLARRMVAQHEQEQSWPDLLLFAGDQVYADDPTPAIVDRLRERHRGRADGEEAVRDEIGDFEEYTWLYRETWGPDAVRWLLSTVPTCMLLDDHDLRDDWNTSQSWREEMARQPWWRERVTGAFASYWVYQHLGNLSPDELAGDRLLGELRAAPDEQTRNRLIDDFARSADDEPSNARWSFSRDLGTTRLLAIDSRCARRLDPDDRHMTDAAEWEWVRDQATGADREEPLQHLLLATTLPAFLLHGIHHAEGFDEAVAEGAWGRWAQGPAEKLRQAADLEHWAAFRRSFDDLVTLLREVAGHPRGPASVLLLSGDVHCSYTARVRLPGVDVERTVVHQLVMSPFRNPLNRQMQVANKLLDSRPVRALTRLLALSAGVREPLVDWDVEQGPWFDNGVMTVVLATDGAAAVEVDHALLRDGHQLLSRTADVALRPAQRGARV
jgi:phosphodiesterase/alkaline phosphatase D-like protein